MGQTVKKRRGNRSMLWLCLTVFLVMFTLSCLTPLRDDDFSYSFSFADDTRIRSVAQIFPSLAAHRELLNGRMSPHFLAHLLLMLPKWVFNFLNGVCAAFLVFLITRFLHTEAPGRALAALAGTLAVWNFSPEFGQNYLWLDGAVNYGWSNLFLLLFLWPYAADYLKLPQRENRILDFLRIPLAAFAGCYSENASLVYLFMAICLLVLTVARDRKIPVFRVAWPVCLAAGYVFMMTAPATTSRSAGQDLSKIANNLARIITETESRLLWMYLILALLFACNLCFRGDKRRIVFAGLCVLGGWASLAAYGFAAYFVPRHFCCTVFLNALAMAVLCDELFAVKKPVWSGAVLAVMAVLFVFRFSLGVLDIAVCCRKAMIREKTILTAVAEGDETVTVDNCIPMTGYALPVFLSTDDASAWPNNVLASYYGIGEVYGREP